MQLQILGENNCIPQRTHIALDTCVFINAFKNPDSFKDLFDIQAYMPYVHKSQVELYCFYRFSEDKYFNKLEKLERTKRSKLYLKMFLGAIRLICEVR
jgi:hypothetical protein